MSNFKQLPICSFFLLSVAFFLQSCATAYVSIETPVQKLGSFKTIALSTKTCANSDNPLDFETLKVKNKDCAQNFGTNEDWTAWKYGATLKNQDLLNPFFSKNFDAQFNAYLSGINLACSGCPIPSGPPPPPPPVGKAIIDLINSQNIFNKVFNSRKIKIALEKNMSLNVYDNGVKISTTTENISTTNLRFVTLDLKNIKTNGVIEVSKFSTESNVNTKIGLTVQGNQLIFNQQ